MSCTFAHENWKKIRPPSLLHNLHLNSNASIFSTAAQKHDMSHDFANEDILHRRKMQLSPINDNSSCALIIRHITESTFKHSWLGTQNLMDGTAFVRN